MPAVVSCGARCAAPPHCCCAAHLVPSLSVLPLQCILQVFSCCKCMRTASLVAVCTGTRSHGRCRCSPHSVPCCPAALRPLSGPCVHTQGLPVQPGGNPGEPAGAEEGGLRWRVTNTAHGHVMQAAACRGRAGGPWEPAGRHVMRATARPAAAELRSCRGAQCTHVVLPPPPPPPLSMFGVEGQQAQAGGLGGAAGGGGAQAGGAVGVPDWHGPWIACMDVTQMERGPKAGGQQKSLGE